MRKRIFTVVLSFALVILASFSAIASELVVYSNWPRDYMDQLKAFFEEKYPDVEMTYLRAAGAELATIFNREMAQGISTADYIFSDFDYMVGYIENGYIEPYVPEGMQYMSPGFYDPEGYWFAIDNGPYVIVYNTRFVSPEEAPKTWADLLDPKWKDAIGIVDPRTAAGVQTPIRLWTYYLEERIGEPFGWNFIAEMAKLNPRLASGHRGLMDLVASGEVLIGSEMPISQTIAAINRGEPIGIVWPAEGNAAVPNTAGIVKNARNIENAKKLHELLASTEGQEFLMSNWGTVPARYDVDWVTPDGKRISDIDIISIAIPEEVRQETIQRFTGLMD